MKNLAQIMMLLFLTLFCGALFGVTHVNAQEFICDEDYGDLTTFPGHDETDVPLDTEITIFKFPCDPPDSRFIVFTEPDGAPELDPLSFTCNDEGGYPFWQVVPRSELKPNTEYRVDVDINNYSSSDVICYFTFTTTGGEGGGGPPPPPPPDEPENVRLDVNISPSGQGEVKGNVIGRAVSRDGIDCPDDCTGSYPPDTALRLTAEPAAGYRFDRWTSSSQVNITDRDGATVEISVAGDGELTAIFVPNSGNSPPTDCEVKIENGAITGDCQDPERDDIIVRKLVIFPEQNRCKEANPDFFSIIKETGGTISFQLSRLRVGVRFCAVICNTDRGSGREGCSQEFCFNRGGNRNVNMPDLPAGFSQSDYKLVSFPVNLSNSSAVHFRGLPPDASPDQVRFLAWDAIAGRYIPYKSLRIVPGRGYWYLSTTPFDGDGIGVPSSSHDVTIYPGYNLIGPPTNNSYQWENILVLAYDNDCRLTTANIRIGDLAANNPFLEKDLLTWNGRGYSKAKTIEAYKGYWVKAKRKITLRFGGSGKTTSADSFKTDSEGSCLINTLAK